jgi:hypothetical protein
MAGLFFAAHATDAGVGAARACLGLRRFRLVDLRSPSFPRYRGRPARALARLETATQRGKAD